MFPLTFPLIRHLLKYYSCIIMIVEIYDNQEFVFVKRYFYDYDNT